MVQIIEVHVISIHALREEGDTSGWAWMWTPGNFYPRPPRGGRRQSIVKMDNRVQISIHALREEGDRVVFFVVGVCNDFYPRPPRGGRPRQRQLPRRAGAFLSTPSARRATCFEVVRCTNSPISIHALREEGDRPLTVVLLDSKEFLSTPSARRATGSRPCGAALLFDFYPRPPRGGRRTRSAAPRRPGYISIHALREEGDGPGGERPAPLAVFLSTPSARRATSLPAAQISRLRNFYPRPPRGGRPAVVIA